MADSRLRCGQPYITGSPPPSPPGTTVPAPGHILQASWSTSNMQIKRWFMGPGGVRAAWRFAAFVALWYGGGYLVFPVLSLFHSFTDTGFTPGDILAYEVGQTVLMLLISLLLAGLEKHGPAWFGLSWGRDALKQFGLGALLGFGMVTLVLLACWTTGHASFEGFAEHGRDLGSYLLIWLGGMLLV